MNIDLLASKTKEQGTYAYFPQVRSACDRELILRSGKSVLNFSSCDYLGLANHEKIKMAAINAIKVYGTNISGPMIFCGYTEYHEKFEALCTELYENRTSLMFTTSYQANIGVLSLVAQEYDLILIDKLAHISLYDAVKLSGKKFRVYTHNNVEVVNKIVESNIGMNILIVTDGVFSADGDFANLTALCKIKHQHPNVKLYVDDAHGVGMLGNKGQGLVEHYNCLDDVDFLIGTMSKAFGSTGGFVNFKNPQLAESIRFRCSTYNASRAVSPGVAAASCMALNINKEEGDSRRQYLKELVEYTHDALSLLNINTLHSKSAVIPIVFSDPLIASRVNHLLMEQGVLGSLFIPPYVERLKSRVRLCLNFNHTKSDIDKLLHVLELAIAVIGDVDNAK